MPTNAEEVLVIVIFLSVELPRSVTLCNVLEFHIVATPSIETIDVSVPAIILTTALSLMVAVVTASEP